MLADFTRAVDLQPELLNIGGGLGIAYLSGDEPPSIEDYVAVKVDGVAQGLRPAAADPDRARALAGRQCRSHRLPVGTVKEIPGVRTYVAVDGGMSDNLRPMLYGARYEALIADRAAEAPDTLGHDRRHALRVG